MLAWYDAFTGFDDFEEFRRRMDRLFEEKEQPRQSARCGRGPRANLFDKGGSYRLELGLPGVALEDIEISGSEGALTISGERKAEVPEGYSAHRQERAALRFRRSFSLPAQVQYEESEAQLKNGILSITLPKAPELKPRSITVRAA